MEKIDSIEFEGELFEETLYHSHSIGKHKSVMTLYAIHSDYMIEWEVDELPTEQIGISVEHMKVIDYDGVMDIPKEALTLLKKNGFDTTEIEGDVK